jgi:tetratricopeptide (TPR) repeat protein
MRRPLASLVMVGALSGCGPAPRETATPISSPAARPSILLVTLDTTRADAIGPEARGVTTPAFDALAARGRRFRQAYATVPETLPSHASMMTGLYPAGHGVHENARFLAASVPVAAEALQQAGYETAAFVSSFALARRFGLARGFGVYDDALAPGAGERPDRETTDRALAFLGTAPRRPLFLWVHYYGPHHPYAPPEPYGARYPKDPYRGEVAAMDEQLGRLVEAFERTAGSGAAIAVVADHGEGLGEHGEAQHGKLLYQATMHVPLVLVGPGCGVGIVDVPVTTRRVRSTLLDWAGLEDHEGSLRSPAAEVVMGEAMKPFVQYGWQPQVMAIGGSTKAILAGRLEAYDLVRDPAESTDLAVAGEVPRPLRDALREYPVPSPGGPSPAAAALDDDARRRLASLGYVSAGAAPVVRKDAPRPADRASLFAPLDAASALFVAERYAEVLPLLDRILAADPMNLDAALRRAISLSLLGQKEKAAKAFAQAQALAPESPDVRAYLGLHYARSGQWDRAAPLLERVVAESPERLPALEALATVREGQGRMEEALDLRGRVYALRPATAAELIATGELAMKVGRTDSALAAFEDARKREGAAFAHDLELGVLFLAARRFTEAAAALDRVPATHPGYPMALFKRAQVSVLLGEADRDARIALARRRADAATRPLIERERLFQGAAAAAPSAKP